MTYIEGTIIDITYRNDENGYTVMSVDVGGVLTTCVGKIMEVSPGEFVRLYGLTTVHHIYGEQFSIVNMDVKLPEDEMSVRLYLGSGLIRGVGEVLAARIVEKFGTRTFDVIKNSPLALAEIKGITKNLAMKIHEQVEAFDTARSQIIALTNMGMTQKQAIKVFELYGQTAAAVVQTNPYRLADEIPKFGFNRSDAIANALGFEKYRDVRSPAGVVHVLKYSANEGHTCLPRRRLALATADELRIDESEAETAINKLIKKGRLTEHIYNDTIATAFTFAYNAENYIANKLLLLAAATPKIEIPERTIKKVLIQADLSEEQKCAIELALSQNVSVITGGPGTGKTTIINQLITILEQSGIKTSLCAPTGRAAKRMERASKRQAQTIHRLLEYGAGMGEDDDEWGSRFSRDEDNPIDAEAVIIDECSMVDIYLMKNLLSACEVGTRIILTGDADQLPSVGPGNVLKDIIASGQIPVNVLTEPFRQSGNIALNAHSVNHGQIPDFFETGDFVFVPTASQEQTLSEIESRYIDALDGASMDEVQIICPLKKGIIGVHNINKSLRERINPKSPVKPELTFGEQTFRLGDKVMQIVNNYSKEWTTVGGVKTLNSGMGVYNGDIGEVVSVDTVDRSLTIIFDGERICRFDINELDQLELAYAITVHKSQGSEFDTVLIPLHYGNSPFLSRNLLYTAMTRAKRKLVIVGAKQSVAFMVQNAHIQGRFTTLDHEIRAAAVRSGDLGGQPDDDIMELLNSIGVSL